MIGGRIARHAERLACCTATEDVNGTILREDAEDDGEFVGAKKRLRFCESNFGFIQCVYTSASSCLADSSSLFCAESQE